MDTLSEVLLNLSVEDTIASVNETTKEISNVLLGSGNNVYWYLIEAGTILHLSGEELTVPEYSITGGIDYDKNSVANKTAIINVVFDNPVSPLSCESWFEDFDNLVTIENLDNLNTSQVTTMLNMFNNCNKLTTLDLSDFDTSQVTNMTAMFDKCYDLTEITFGSNFVTNNVTHMIGMFSGCRSLSTIDLSSFDVSQVEEMYFMFNDCKNLTTLDLSNFDIGLTCVARDLLANCPNLSHITISESVSNIINEAGLTGNWKDVSLGTVYNYDGTYTTIPEGIAGEYTNYHVYWYLTMSGAILHLSGTIPTPSEYVTGQDYYNKDSIVNKVAITKVVFDNPVCPFNCESWLSDFENLLMVVDIDNLDTTEVVNMSKMFYNCKKLTSIDLSNFVTCEVTDMKSMFHFCEDLTSLDVSSFDTSKVTDMNRMFSTCKSLTALDVHNFNTSQVTNMSFMFAFCENVDNLDVSNFVTSEVTDMSQMFVDCSSLTNLDVRNFNTSKVGNMSSMFSGCSNITNLDVHNFNTQEVIYIFSMFKNCSSLTSLDVRNFDTNKVINIQGMFNGCNNLIYLDLSNFNIDQVPNDRLVRMLFNCENLNHIKISESLSLKINDLGLIGDWRDASTGVVYNYDADHTTISIGVAGEYKKTFTITFETNGGTAKSNMVVGYGDKIATPTDVIKTGYYVENWYTDDLFTNVWDFDNNEIMEDMTLYAKWDLVFYYINYNTNGGSISPAQITKTYDENIILGTPTRIGYIFEGWFTDNGTFINQYYGTTDLVDIPKVVVDIYAKWVAISYFINYNANGGIISSMQITKTYDVNVILDTPTKTDYIFAGWFTDNDTFINQYDGTTDLANTQGAVVDIYAKWEKLINKYTVTFNSNGGSTIASVVVNEGEIVTRPINPKKRGYIFVNWYKETELISKFDFNTIITSDIILYAKWKKYTPLGGGSGGGGGNGNVILQRDPIKESAIPTCEKSKNTNELNNNLIKWNYDPLRRIWGLDVTINNEKVLYKYGYAMINNHTYYFDEKGNMVTGWVRDTNGDYYAFEWQKTANEGMMLFGWRLVNDKWYYFKENGRLLTNDITPDGYKVDAEGVWIK